MKMEGLPSTANTIKGIRHATGENTKQYISQAIPDIGAEPAVRRPRMAFRHR
jgi:hypothetical protein